MAAPEDLGVPRAGATYSRATSAAAARYQIPASWYGQYVMIAAKGFELQVVFGGTGVTAAMDTDSSVSGEALTPAAGTAYPVPAENERPFLIPAKGADNEVTHFSIIAAGAGRWFGYRAQNRGS